MKLGPNTKPHRNNAGYVCEMLATLGGHIVIYDRERGADYIDADSRWIVMHEPSSLHVAVKSMAMARDTMKGVAKARTIDEARSFADILPRPGDFGAEQADDDAATTVANQARLSKRVATDAERKAALDRFLADPENEPTREGLRALDVAFGLREPS